MIYNTRHMKRATPPFYSLKGIFDHAITLSIFDEKRGFKCHFVANSFCIKFHSSDFEFST